MISSIRIAHWISLKLRASFVHVHCTTVQHCSVECRNSALGLGRLCHLHEGHAAGFARIPVLDDGNGFDGAMGCKQFPELLLRDCDIQVSDKDVSHEFILWLVARLQDRCLRACVRYSTSDCQLLW